MPAPGGERHPRPTAGEDIIRGPAAHSPACRHNQETRRSGCFQFVPPCRCTGAALRQNGSPSSEIRSRPESEPHPGCPACPAHTRSTAPAAHRRPSVRGPANTASRRATHHRHTRPPASRSCARSRSTDLPNRPDCVPALRIAQTDHPSLDARPSTRPSNLGSFSPSPTRRACRSAFSLSFSYNCSTRVLCSARSFVPATLLV
jgi:hypothetical protein